MPKKVVLVMPNVNWKSKGVSQAWTIWPTSLCIIAGILERDYKVTVLDANINNMSEERFKQKIREENPFVVGISFFSDDFRDCGYYAAHMTKEVNPEIVVIAGGIYIILNVDEAMGNGDIDYFVLGEGEFVLKELLDFISGVGKSLPQKGLAFREKDKNVIQGRNDLIQDLDSLPFPAYHKMDFLRYSETEIRASAYRPDTFPYGRIMTSRGCPYNCCYCQNKAIHGQKIRFRSPQKVLDEMEWMKKTYGIRSLLVDDANFAVSKSRAKEIINGMIGRKLGLKWKAMNLAVFTLDYELLELMVRSGCDYIDLAIESGVPRVIKEIIHKPLSLEHVEKIIKKAKELSFKISANFIIGFPGETWEEIRQTVKFAEGIDIDYIKIMAAMPLRHTELYNVAYEHGYLSDDFSFRDMKWGFGEIETEEFSVFDVSVLRAYEWDRINFSSDKKIERVANIMGITKDEIERIRKETRKKIALWNRNIIEDRQNAEE